MAGAEQGHQKAIIGDVDGPAGFWLYDSIRGYDLTHPDTPSTPTVPTAVTLETETQPITIDPAKSALVIVDMQNFFLAPELGRPADSAGLEAQRRLIEHGIPAARKAGIRVIWLNWGLTESDLKNMPPSFVKEFGFRTVAAAEFNRLIEAKKDANVAAAQPEEKLKPGRKDSRIYTGLGAELGPVVVNGGTKTISAGRMLMRDQWNSDLTPEMKEVYEAGLLHDPPDVWIHKVRMSGFGLGGSSNPGVEFLEKHGIKTLFFAGVNTDQCVGGSLQDAFTKGYDVVLLRDGAATNSPDCAQQGIEYNCRETWGFSLTCKQLWDGVEKSRSS